ncbi:2-dehydropantoate 2-reductase [Shewanella electrodiphila]|uniref:2-dehydropantoate 2-reductase n=1 Tax=Shewanella electrodiphila TaxID=934143 RepID=A0ABT0KVM6_9GAMM|nr:2-dehydropantoate 2-reductase [Shewanella electrodiphila]MCL1047450.1 2-dehydropantoate 2-reductase [Shewanella electrodiphila]
MKIAIFGAGSTGCYLAGELLMAKLDVSLICRERIKRSITDNQGITLTSYQGLHQKVMPNALFTEVEADTPKFDLIFVTLKCHQVSEISEQLLQLSHQKSTIVLMQNGLGSLDEVKQALANISAQPRLLIQGITPFNVLQKEHATFHKGTEGEFIFANTPHTQTVQQAMLSAGLSCTLAEDMAPIIYGKLLLNLNNALNAITDVPIKQQLSQKQTRKLLSLAMKEWLAVCQKARLPLAQFTKVKPQWLPLILSLPDGLFTLLAKQMLDIDPQARSSMWEDIQAKRKTEIDYLNQAVVELGKQYQVNTPINAAICAGIKKLEQGIPVDIAELL